MRQKFIWLATADANFWEDVLSAQVPICIGCNLKSEIRSLHLKWGKGESVAYIDMVIISDQTL